ncbi:MAG TPA: hypothetical protein VFM43_06050 [Gaiellaceae bacterium]|nr:hypothetical protein [Gaiellaceae bacterium]
MKVVFIKQSARRYAVEVRRDRYPDLWCGTIGYHEWLPHDLLHFVAEAEYCLDGGIFGDLAAGGNARIFLPLNEEHTVDTELVTKLWRKQRIRRTRLPDGRRSEELAWQLQQGWRARNLPPRLQQKLDVLAGEWHGLQVGQSLTLEWPRPEGRKRHPPRERRRPTANRHR